MPKTKHLGPGGVAVKRVPPSYSPFHWYVLIQGPPKVGKTSTIAALADVSEDFGITMKPFFFLLESGSGGVEVNCTVQNCPVCDGSGKNGRSKCEECEGVGVVRKLIDSIKELEEWLIWFVRSDYNIAVFDTVDALYQLISREVCKELGVESPSQAAHGQAWTDSFMKIRNCVGLLKECNKSIIFISHVRYVDRRVGQAIVPTATFDLPGQARPWLEGAVNTILHFDVVPGRGKDATDRHVIRCKPEAGVHAGDQWGLFTDELDRGDSPEDGARAILSCFYD